MARFVRAVSGGRSRGISSGDEAAGTAGRFRCPGGGHRRRRRRDRPPLPVRRALPAHHRGAGARGRADGVAGRPRRGVRGQAARRGRRHRGPQDAGEPAGADRARQRAARSPARRLGRRRRQADLHRLDDGILRRPVPLLRPRWPDARARPGGDPPHPARRHRRARGPPEGARADPAGLPVGGGALRRRHRHRRAGHRRLGAAQPGHRRPHQGGRLPRQARAALPGPGRVRGAHLGLRRAVRLRPAEPARSALRPGVGVRLPALLPLVERAALPVPEPQRGRQRDPRVAADPGADHLGALGHQVALLQRHLRRQPSRTAGRRERPSRSRRR